MRTMLGRELSKGVQRHIAGEREEKGVGWGGGRLEAPKYESMLTTSAGISMRHVRGVPRGLVYLLPGGSACETAPAPAPCPFPCPFSLDLQPSHSQFYL